MTKALVICGPTATGKTSLGLTIAKKLPGETTIFSVDSRQVYPEVKIISGQDVPVDLPSNIHFFGINLFSAKNPANLSEFVNLTRKAIFEAVQKDHHLIVIGGTGLYLKGLLEELSDINIPQDEKLRERLNSFTTQELQLELKKISKKRFESLNNSDQSNPRRLIRHIEIAQNQKPLKNIFPLPKLNQKVVGLLPPKDLTNLIKKRVIERLDAGAVNEVKALLKKHPNQKLPIYSTLGIPQILQFLNQKISKEELINLWTVSEVNYAKRQMVWFKKQNSIIWYDENTDRIVLSDSLVEFIK